MSSHKNNILMQVVKHTLIAIANSIIRDRYNAKQKHIKNKNSSTRNGSGKIEPYKCGQQ